MSAPKLCPFLSTEHTHIYYMIIRLMQNMSFAGCWFCMSNSELYTVGFSYLDLALLIK
jgi:hypothetical protein